MWKKRTLPVLASLIAVIFALTALSADADARRKRKRKRGKKAKVVHKINQQALGELMGPFKFGMSKKKVIGILARQIKERYKEKIQGTADVYQQDKLRRDRDKEIKRIGSGYTQFKGKKTGWDVSIVDDQFAHNTDESLLDYWENVGGKDQRRFFFFHEGSLYKMFIALNSSMLKDDQRKFAFFKTVMEARYGTGSVLTEVRDGVKVPTALEWNTSKYHVKAIDKLSFYNSFCLVVAQPSAERTVAALRKSQHKNKQGNTIIKAIVTTPEDDEPPSLDSNSSSVDAILRD